MPCLNDSKNMTIIDRCKYSKRGFSSEAKQPEGNWFKQGFEQGYELCLFCDLPSG